MAANPVGGMLVEAGLAAGFAQGDGLHGPGGGDVDQHEQPPLDALLAGPAWIRRIGELASEGGRKPLDGGSGGVDRGRRRPRGGGGTNRGHRQERRHGVTGSAATGSMASGTATGTATAVGTVAAMVGFVSTGGWAGGVKYCTGAPGP